MLGYLGGGFSRALAVMSGRPALVSDLDPARSEASFEQIIARCSHVVVATPNATHYEVARAVLEAGRNVMVLKPYVQTPREASDLFALARRKGLLARVGLNQRYRRELAEVKRPLSGSFFWCSPGEAKRAPFYSTRYDLGVHALDLAFGFFPRSRILRSVEYFVDGAIDSWHASGEGWDITVIRDPSAPSVLSFSLQTERGFAKVEERGPVETWDDGYTFAAMIESFVAGHAEDEERVLRVVEALCG